MWQSVRRLFGSAASDAETPPLDAADALRIARHAKFCTALPFPALSWTDETSVESSLRELRDYAEQLANSALDWYLEKKVSKKRFAACLHRWTYVFGVLAAVIPLLMLNLGKFLDPFVKQYFGIECHLSSIAAETALLLAGIAGGATLIDRTAGFTADWMRYITTAADINRALIEFQFEWDMLDQSAPYLPRTKTSQPPIEKTDKEIDPVAQRIERARVFCLNILEFTRRETSVWADELKARVTQMEGQLQSLHRP
jgi:SMODS and SLOG-associating 2TM effector domain 2